MLDMAALSITKNFVVSGQRQVERFADAIENSYQESLHSKKVRLKNNSFTWIRRSEKVYGKKEERRRGKVISDLY